MNKTIILFLLLTIGFTSCKNTEKKIDRVKIAKQYFKVLDNSDYSKISDWFADSLTMIEGEYKHTYSKSDYLEFLKWDSVFDPNYEILKIEQKNEIVKAKISKIDKRISFLHKEPFITNQTIKFQNEKIITVQTEYVDFNEATWERNKNGLLSWINEHHPELNEFIYDQTKAGGIKFLKAIELYKSEK
ncbi:hypothetical protein [Zunongwangia sp. HGR-M22]|uniref:hypothetical protein n=1 Tax=Zunongwangia sp. HGR-M22 TaxID=3015168 RepID=UPI0022DD3A56|nr:hypothetical protein [Zunongwangia sp. HGR-M22]WBL25346.1 hypothetical protein PBT91_15780 [Zunongwangia sp. HGR-M22]